MVGTVLLGAIVLAHRGLYDAVSWFPDLPRALATDQSAAMTIYLGFAGIVAIVAGFAGVVVVFALGQDSDRFLKLRLLGGSALRANWSSPIATSFSAAFGSALCALAAVADHGFAAWWLFEFFFLLAVVAATRLVWLFRALAGLVATDDEQEANRRDRENTVDIGSRLHGRRALGD